MSSRELILARVRRNQPAWRELPQLPRFARPLADPLAAFAAALQRMGGTLADAPAGVSIDEFLRARFPDATVICSAVPEVRRARAASRRCATRPTSTTSTSASSAPCSASPRPARSG